MERLEGKIVSVERGWITIRAPMEHIGDYVHKGYDKAIVMLPDGRTITPQQRKKIWAMVGEIGDHYGYFQGEKNGLNDQMKGRFLTSHVDELTAQAIRLFSTSDCDQETASMYIDYLVNVIVQDGIPTKVPLVEYCEDVQRYVYACLCYKRCAVCGKPCDLHHVEGSKIGMGNDRRKVEHIGRDALPLCRIHHQEAHDHGDQVLMDKYHLEPVKIDKKIKQLYKLKMGGNHEQTDYHRESDPRP